MQQKQPTYLDETYTKLRLIQFVFFKGKILFRIARNGKQTAILNAKHFYKVGSPDFYFLHLLVSRDFSNHFTFKVKSNTDLFLIDS